MYYYGDELYGIQYNVPNIRNLIERQALHCHKINFIHPITNKSIEFISKLPEDMQLLF
jgi:23S rRNA pseudouridine1911/1915/1917 synthase